MDSETLYDLVFQTIKMLSPEVPGGISWLDTYESIKFPKGYEKPTKEEFEAKLQELIDAQPLKELRTERNKRLVECDWVVIRATSTDTPVPEEWKTYMQALRDLPSTTEDPANPVWPVRPDEVVPTEETPTEETSTEETPTEETSTEETPTEETPTEETPTEESPTEETPTEETPTEETPTEETPTEETPTE